MVALTGARYVERMSATPRPSPVPAVLRLVQEAVLGRWRATSEDLYREVIRLTGFTADQEMVVVGCGEGDVTESFAMRTGGAITGVDPDREVIAAAESRARDLQPPKPIHYELGALDDLPHQDAVFDVAVGQPALSAAGDPAKAVAELTRVVKPLGWVVLLQPTWSSEVAAEDREAIVQRLGLRPHLLVEWKQMLRAANVVEIQVQDWTAGSPGGSGVRSGGPVEAPLFGWRQKAQIVTDAVRRAGWREARAALERESSLLQELSRERTIGFQLMAGVKWHLQQAEA
jgi:SAM-dependent methyltransferase